MSRLTQVSAPIYEASTVPKIDVVLRAVELCPANKTKVIIMGQDPYPTREHAMGLAFSVPKSVKALPPSLRNVFRELVADVGVPFPTSGDLTPWAERGVLLLNRVLTVEEGKSGSHIGMGWEKVTGQIVHDVLEWNNPLVIIAWGAKAQKGFEFEAGPVTDNVLYLTGGHPSPLNTSVPFRGGRYFSKANEWLAAKGVSPIDWRLP